MRLSQPLKKLGKARLTGYHPTNLTWDALPPKALLESDQRGISESVSFNSRRVLLTDASLDPYRIITISDDPLQHILYSEQRAIKGAGAFVYDYNLLDATDQAVLISFVTSQAASGLQRDSVATPSSSFPVHMSRISSTSSEEVEHMRFTKLFALLPSYLNPTTDMELQIGVDNYVITEVVVELLTKRLILTRR